MPTFVRKVSLKNYKSIARCSVALGPLTFLVGPNGAGKSNFMDALRLVADGLRAPLDYALRERGGAPEVRRRSAGHPTHFSIRLDLDVPDAGVGHYAFEVGAKLGAFEVSKEECSFPRASFSVRSGVVGEASETVMPPASADRLYLANAAGLPSFRPIFDALSQMGFYNLSPQVMRELQDPDAGMVLARDGRNLTSVLTRVLSDPDRRVRVEEMLRAVVPGIEAVDVKRLGHKETLEFRQRVENQDKAWSFPAHAMSDGTLRALGVLVALFQPANRGEIPLVGIEEPEVALHPAAAGVLVDALKVASRERQILVTSHSPELLDDESLEPDQVRAVVAREGRTEIAAIDDAGAKALRAHLFTPGELLRSNQLIPDEDEIERVHKEQLVLFGDA
jgi:predicted ATPase